MKYRISLLLLPFFVAACGDSSSEKDDHAHHGHDMGPADMDAASLSTDDAVSVVDGVTVVKMSGNDRMKFSLEAFSVPAGSPVKLEFSNVGKMPKAAMGHNVVFLSASADENAFVAAAASARDNEYVPANMEDSMLAYTKMLGPGEVDTIEFKAPAEPGEYLYLCSFPAHMFAGMRGVMTVE